MRSRGTRRDALESGGPRWQSFYRDSYFKWSHPLAGRGDMSDEEIARDRFVIGDPSRGRPG
jgi:hypothetical protein